MKLWNVILGVLILSCLVVATCYDQETKGRTLPAQGLETVQPKMHVEVELVTVGVRVTDRKGKEVQGLKQNDFTLYDNGQPQKLAFFSNQELPISLVILLDRSASMERGHKLDRAKEAALSLVHSSHAQTEFLFIPFNHTVLAVQGFTQDRGLVESLIRATEASGGTSLYDAVFAGIWWCTRASQPRQVMVIVSDGGDEHSVHGLDETIQAIKNSQVEVYTIGYYTPEEAWLFQYSYHTIRDVGGKMVINPAFVLRQMAKESGADAFFPRGDRDLSSAVEKIANDVATQYTLAFYPPENAQPGQYRTVMVKVDRNNVNVRARPGYTFRPQLAGAPQ